MGMHLVDRLTSSFPFRALLLVSGVFVLPVLAAGLAVTPFFLKWQILVPESAPEAVTIVGLSLGGAIGMTGWVLALIASKTPERHNLTATLLCLCVGVLTALAVTALLIVRTISTSAASGADSQVLGAAAFSAGTAIWALDGLGWMQRLLRRYAERTGHAFDGLPVAMLFVALMLAAAATLGSMTL